MLRLARLVAAVALGLAIAPPPASAAAPTPAALEQLFFANQLGALQTQAQGLEKQNPALGWGYVARVAYKQGRWDAARAALAHAGLHDLEGVYANADFALFIGEVGQARSLFQKARQLDPGHSHAIYGLAASALDSGAYDEAYDLAEGAEGMAAREGAFQHSRILTILGGAQGLKADRGSLMDKLRFGPRVRSTLERAVALAPGNPNAQYAVGRYYLEAPAAIGGNPGRSVGYLERAVGHDPYFFLANAWLIRAYRKTNQAGKARELLSSYRRKFAGMAAPMREIADL